MPPRQNKGPSRKRPREAIPGERSVGEEEKGYLMEDAGGGDSAKANYSFTNENEERLVEFFAVAS